MDPCGAHLRQAKRVYSIRCRPETDADPSACAIGVAEAFSIDDRRPIACLLFITHGKSGPAREHEWFHSTPERLRTGFLLRTESSESLAGRLSLFSRHGVARAVEGK